MKKIILSQTAWNTLETLQANVTEIEQAYTLNESEMTFIKDSFTDVCNKVIAITEEHKTEKLDFEGMVNMVSGMFEHASSRSTDKKTEALHWSGRRAKAMAATAVELAIESINDIKSAYHYEEVPKKKMMVKDGASYLMHYTWHRNYFECKGVYLNQEQRFLDDGLLPDGFSFVEGDIGSSKISTKDGSRYKVGSHYKDMLRKVGSTRLTFREFSEKELFKNFQRTETYKQQYASANVASDITRKYKVMAKFVARMAQEEFHLVYKYQGSSRLQAVYGQQDVGLHTGGKYLYRLADSRVVTLEDRIMAKFILGQTWFKKVKGAPRSFKQVLKGFKKNHAEIIKWFTESSQNDIVKYTYFMDMINDVVLAGENGETNLALSLDLTASGPMRHALNFHSEGMAKPTNMIGNKVPNDFHQEMLERSPITDDTIKGKSARDAVKQLVQNPWTHGSSFYTPAMAMEIEPEEFASMLSESYGPEALYAERIGSMTSDLVNKNDGTVTIQGPRGFLHVGAAYFEGSVTTVKYPSILDGKLKDIKIFGNAPLHYNKKGRVINKKKTENIKGDTISEAHAGAKNRLMYALDIHAVETMGTLELYEKLTEPLFSVHDDYFTTGKGLFQTLRILRDFHLWIYDETPIHGMIANAFDRKGINLTVEGKRFKDNLEAVHYMFPLGDLKRSQVANSFTFLQP